MSKQMRTIVDMTADKYGTEAAIKDFQQGYTSMDIVQVLIAANNLVDGDYKWLPKMNPDQKVHFVCVYTDAYQTVMGIQLGRRENPRPLAQEFESIGTVEPRKARKANKKRGRAGEPIKGYRQPQYA